jgi:hypothetical protein
MVSDGNRDRALAAVEAEIRQTSTAVNPERSRHFPARALLLRLRRAVASLKLIVTGQFNIRWRGHNNDE